MLFAIGGVALISLFSEKDTTTTVRNTPLGYVVGVVTLYPHLPLPPSLPLPSLQYLVISTVLYAVIEVLFKKFVSTKDDTAPVCNSFRFVGIMGVHSLLWMWWVWSIIVLPWLPHDPPGYLL